MNKAPERIWAWHWHSDWNQNLPESGPRAIPQFGYCRPNNRHPLDNREKESGAEYIRADLMPRWRPIAELPNEWKDGRDLVVLLDGKPAAMSYADVDWIRDNRITMFCDFGGKSMPD